MRVISQAARDVIAERQRQKTVEGWSEAHDDRNHSAGELARAAAAYAYAGAFRDFNRNTLWRRLWPWSWEWWKPKDRRYDLVRAGALILAEIERLDRKVSPSPSSRQ